MGVVIFHKPRDVVVTLRDGFDPKPSRPLASGRLEPSCRSLLGALPKPWCTLLAPHVPALRPVGRLDAASVGLLLLTDSSRLAATLTSPGLCEKEYLLRVRPAPGAAALTHLREGVDIENGIAKRGLTHPCRVTVEQEVDGG